MDRTIFTDEHHAFREMVRDFLEKEVAPYHAEWEKQGHVSREVWLVGRQDGPAGPRRGGALGRRRVRRPDVPLDPLRGDRPRAASPGLGFPLANDVVTPYLTELTTEEQKERWLPRFCSGEMITAIAMTEPGTGSDLQGIQTKRRPRRRRVGHQRREDLHHQRHHEPTSSSWSCKTDPDAGSQGLQPHRRRARRARLRARPQPREDRHVGAGHRRAVLHRLPRARRRTSSARRARASSTSCRTCPASGSPSPSPSTAGAEKVLDGHDHLRQGAHGLRQADRASCRTPASSSPRWRRSSRSPAPSSTAASPS